MVKGRVGIVLVNYNGELFIVDCVNSLLNQTYKDIEIIIWDNNSQDDSVRIIKQNYPSIRLIENKQNDGFARANNLAVKELLKGDAEYILLLNVDTVSDRFLIENLLEKADENTVTTGQISMDRENRLIWYGGGELQFDKGKSIHINMQVKNEKKVSFICGCCMMIHREIIKKYGLFDSKYYLYYEDTDLCMRWYLQGVEMYYIPKAKLWHKVGGSLGGGTNPIGEYYRMRNRLLYTQKFKKYVRVNRTELSVSVWKALEMELLKGEFQILKAQLWGIVDYCLKRTGKLEHKII